MGLCPSASRDPSSPEGVTVCWSSEADFVAVSRSSTIERSASAARPEDGPSSAMRSIETMIGQSRGRFRLRILSLPQTEPFIPRGSTNLGLDPVSNGFRAAIYSGYLASVSSTLTLRLGRDILDSADRTLFTDFRQLHPRERTLKMAVPLVRRVIHRPTSAETDAKTTTRKALKRVMPCLTVFSLRL